MMGRLFAQTESFVDRIEQFLASPLIRLAVSSLLLGIAIYLLLPGRRKPWKWWGGTVGVVGIGLVMSLVPMTGKMSIQVAFWVVASLAVFASTATVTSRSPVYCAIWFAVSLLGVAGLFFLEGAQFLAIATVAVYAGAIVVTFLFVLMLAQPEGLAYYDRITWGRSPRFLIPFLATALTFVLASTMTTRNEAEGNLLDVVTRHVKSLEGLSTNARLDGVRVRRFDDQIAEIQVRISGEAEDVNRLNESRDELKKEIAIAVPELSASVIRVELSDNIYHTEHVAHLGRRLFGRYLIALQVGGCLLMVALVGALAIAAHGSGHDLHAPIEPEAGGH